MKDVKIKPVQYSENDIWIKYDYHSVTYRQFADRMFKMFFPETEHSIKYQFISTIGYMPTLIDK